MGMTGLLEDVHMAGIDVDADVAAARSGDEASFGRLVERHRRELHVHCYRMIGSFTDAEDLVQETFLRAWRHRKTFEGAGFRAWLYRIATNACLDVIRRNKRQLRTLNSFARCRGCSRTPIRCSTRSRHATTSRTPSRLPARRS